MWAGSAALGGEQSGALQVCTRTFSISRARAHATIPAQVARADAAARRVQLRSAVASSKPLSFRCMQDALVAARDGDRIVMQLGHHNMAGSSAIVDKRVLIRGEGSLGDTYVEQRSNAPLMIASAPAVVQNLSLDLCGFRECVLVQGDSRSQLLLEDCKLRSSGSHAIVTREACQPKLRRLDVGAAKAGLLALQESQPQLMRCAMTACGEQAVRAQDRSRVALQGCRLAGNEAEGAVAMDASHLSLSDCVITSNKGPALDISGTAHAIVRGGEVANNAGGMFLWDTATARLEGARLSGGQHHALLVGDDGARAVALGCTIEGEVMATLASSLRLEQPPPQTNVMKRGKQAATLPPEEGCFKFEADRYLRKQ